MVIGGLNRKRNPKLPWFSNLIAKCALILIVAVILTAILLFLWLDVFIWKEIING